MHPNEVKLAPAALDAQAVQSGAGGNRCGFCSVLVTGRMGSDAAGGSGYACCCKTFCKHPKLCYYHPCLYIIHMREKRLWEK